MRTEKTEAIPQWMLEPNYSDIRIQYFVGREMSVFRDDDNVILNYDKPRGDYSVEDAHYDYSDKLQEALGIEVMERAANTAKETVGNDNTAEYFEVMLQNAFEDPTIQLHHLLVSMNRFDGQHVRVYGISSQADRIANGQE